jgi:site-specific recombinase XerD
MRTPNKNQASTSLAKVTRSASTEKAIRIVLDSLTSEHSKRAYARHLTAFLAWHSASGKAAINKALVQRYAAEMSDAGKSAASINQSLSAIRKLAGEAADNGALGNQIASGIKAVKGVRQEGTRTGNWLTKQDAQKMLNAPDTDTLKGLRDRAILAVLIGCGLRRAEAANLAFAHIQQRDGRWVLVDLIGKRNKVRSVPMPNWTKQAIDEYASAGDLSQGQVFRPINKGGRITGERISEQAFYNTVAEYADGLDLANIAPHDLRRTFAKLAHKGGSALDQIQLSLGHSSIQTTERYLGVEQDLTDAPCDHLGLRL